jgi:hypothetical protein
LPPPSTLPDKVKEIINTYFDIDIDFKCRKRELVQGRQMYYNYLKDNTRMNNTEIAATILYKPDRTTMYNYANQHQDLLFNKKYKREWEALLEHIKVKLSEQE